MKKIEKKKLNKKATTKMNTVKAYAGCKCWIFGIGWRGILLDSQPWPW